MPARRLGISGKIRSVERVEFVGRAFHLDLFTRNLQREPSDHAYRNIFNLYGQGGVGKTWLVRKYEQLAQEASALTAVVDTGVEDVPQAMEVIARNFEQQGHTLKSFSDRYRTYRQKVQEVESDPDAPTGLTSLTRTAAKVGLGAARLGVTVGGGGPLLAAADEFKLGERFEEAVVAGVDVLTSFLRKKLRSEDANLVMDPIGTMTPLFVNDLMQAPPEHTPILFFDTYERTAVFLDRWLRDLFKGRYGDIPVDTILVIAGRDELGKGSLSDPADAGSYPWSDFYPYLERVSLEPFSDVEAREYLRRRGITSDQVVEMILRLSGRLPLLLNTLASEAPDAADAIGDPTGTAVERFLQWIDDPLRREAALAGSLPRLLNQDVLALLVQEDQAPALFEWLRQRPFVEGLPGGGWAYSRLVRELMLRHQRQVSHERWSTAHNKLVAYYDSRAVDLGVNDGPGYLDDDWQTFTLNALYHRLCAAPQPHLPHALRGFVSAVDRQRRFGRRWAETMVDAGTDAGHAATREWGEKLSTVVRASAPEEYASACDALTDLMAAVELEPELKARALNWRGYLRQRAGQHELALQDLTRAIELKPDKAEYRIDRAITYVDLKEYDRAIADATAALEHEPDSERAHALRGFAKLVQGEYDASLADMNRALTLAPGNAYHHFNRALVFLRLDRPEDALEDCRRALELGYEPPVAVHGELSRTYLALRRYPEALAEADRISELDPDNPSPSVLRGVIYQKMGDASRAAAALAEVIPRMTSFVSQLREQARHLPLDAFRREAQQWLVGTMGLSPNDAEQAMKVTMRGMEADPETASRIFEADLLAMKAAVHFSEGKLDEALEIADRMLDLDEDPRYLLLRATILLHQGKLDEAQADLDRAIALDDTFARAFGTRSIVHQAKGQPQEALSDLSRALEHIPDEGSLLLARGQLYLGLGRLDEALADFTQMVERGIEPLARALSYRGVVLVRLHRLDEALADVSRAMELDPENQFIRGMRLAVYRAMGDFDRLAEGLAEAEESLGAFVDQYHSRVAAGEEELARLSVVQWVTNTGAPLHVMWALYGEMITILDAGPERAKRHLQAQVAAANASECAQLSQLEPALASMNRAVELMPDNPDYLVARAEIHERLQRYDAALADLARALELAPDHLDVLKQRGVLLRGQKRYDEALSDLARVAELAPDDASAIAHRGETYRLQARYDDALNDFTRAIELMPDYPFAISSRAETYYALGRYEEALADFDRVIEADPQYVWALINRGHTYQAMGRHEEAIADYSAALEVRPDEPGAIGGRGQSLRYLRRLREALEDLNRLRETAPELPWTLVERGKVYFLQGQNREALDDLNRALQSEPDNEDALLTRGQIYRALHSFEDALADFDGLIAREPDFLDWVLYQRSFVFLEQEDADRFRDDLARAIRIAAENIEREPTNVAIRMNRALYHLASGDAPAAEQHYRAALRGGARPETVRDAVYDIEDLQALMPDNEDAAAMRDLLGSSLEEP